MEKEIKSVSNITRKDVREFLKIAASILIKPETEIYPFEMALFPKEKNFRAFAPFWVGVTWGFE